jgi:hypothetical protein
VAGPASGRRHPRSQSESPPQNQRGHRRRDYGAVGNGIADDLAALQAAINAAQTAGGGIVSIQAGVTLMVSGIPTITGSNIVVRGAGASSKILLAPASANAAGTTIGIWCNGATNVLIENLCVDGNFTNIAKNGTFETASTLWSPVIAAYGAQGPKTYIQAGGGIDSATYLNKRMPIRITNSHNVTVRGCLIQNSISAGILADSASVNGCTDILITDNRIKLTWDNGIYFHQGVQFGTATGNEISDTQYNGVSAVYCDHILITGNNIRNAGPSLSDSGGVQINGSSNCAVTGNMIDNCQFYGVDVLASQETNITGGAAGNQVWSNNNTITSNTITGCRANDYPTHNAPGVNLFGAAKTIVAQNVINNCDYGVSAGSQVRTLAVLSNSISAGVIGVNVGQSADLRDVTIRNNLISGNTSNGVYCNGTGTRIESNTIVGNGSMGVNLSQPPAAAGQKTDYVIGNTIIGNADSGVYVDVGATNVAVVKGNTFGNPNQAGFTDGVITNGSPTLTSATAAFTAADVGRVLVLECQGADGTATATTVSAVTNATTVTLAANAVATQTGTAFWVGRGPVYFADGSTDASNATVLTSATAAFTASDVGALVELLTLDSAPRVLWSGTIASRTSATQVVLSGAVGSYPAVGFIVNRSQGQQIRAINRNTGTLMDIGNTILGQPELLSSGTTTNLVRSYNAGFPRARSPTGDSTRTPAAPSPTPPGRTRAPGRAPWVRSGPQGRPARPGTSTAPTTRSTSAPAPAST